MPCFDSQLLLLSFSTLISPFQAGITSSRSALSSLGVASNYQRGDHHCREGQGEAGRTPGSREEILFERIAQLVACGVEILLIAGCHVLFLKHQEHHWI